jgi:surface polysaccharide O-acyltransferase-like enzyme
VLIDKSGAGYGTDYHLGGWRWQSFSYSLWEQLFAILFSIGLIALFKRAGNASNRLTRLGAENSFGVYIFHSVFVTLFAVLMKDVQISAFGKCFILVAAGSVSTLAFVVALRRVKIVRKILG